MSRVLVACGLLVFPVIARAQDSLYTDPQHRFSIRIPESWQAQATGNTAVRFQGDGLSIEIAPGDQALGPAVQGATQQLSGVQEIDRQSATVVGQQVSWVLLEAADQHGARRRIRVQTVQGGGAAAVVIVSGEHSAFNAQRGSIEAILATLRLGSNAPSDYRTYANRAPAARDTTAEPTESSDNDISLGLSVREITPADVQWNGNATEGLLVDGVDQGGPADQAGVLEGDVILEIDRNRMDDVETFNGQLRLMKVGDEITVAVERNGRKRRVTLKVGGAE